MDALRALTRSSLREASLLAAVFALIAGILGMHVMTGTHSAHATAAATHSQHASAEVSAHCSCAGDCGDQHAASLTCTPSLAAGVLAAPAPDTITVLPATLQPADFTSASVWQYRPAGPSPGDLSISRT